MRKSRFTTEQIIGIIKPSGLYPDYLSVECGAVQPDPINSFLATEN